MKIGFINSKKEGMMVKFEDSWYNPFEDSDFKIIREFIKDLIKSSEVKKCQRKLKKLWKT